MQGPELLALQRSVLELLQNTTAQLQSHFAHQLERMG